MHALADLLMDHWQGMRGLLNARDCLFKEKFDQSSGHVTLSRKSDATGDFTPRPCLAGSSRGQLRYKDNLKVELLDACSMGRLIAFPLILILALQRTAHIDAQSGALLHVPTAYSTDRLQKPRPNQVDYYVAAFCEAETKAFDQRTARVVFNLPFNLQWVTRLGIINATVSNTTDFSHVLCSNARSTSLFLPNCTFIYNTEMGSNIYFKIVAGKGGLFAYTLGISFLAESRMLAIERNIETGNFGHAQTEPPSNFLSLLPIIHPVFGTVATTESVLYAVFLGSASICKVTSLLTVSVTGRTVASAFSTYVCNTVKCTPDLAGVVAYDVSDSTENIVTANSTLFMPGGTVFILVTGFGGKEKNDFSISVLIAAKKR
eukprot:m.307908 g.307908  ORF g.307908 m.307908 type:complete len:375 (+) comp43009_c0_seq1:69-1193(+)